MNSCCRCTCHRNTTVETTASFAHLYILWLIDDLRPAAADQILKSNKISAARGTPIGHAISARISSSRPADFPAYVVALDPRHDNSRSVIRSHFGRRHQSGTPGKLPKRPNSHRVDRETIHQKKPPPHNDAPTAVPCLFLNIGRPVVSDTAPGPHAGKPAAAKVSGGGSRKRTTPPTILVRNTRRG